VALSDDITRLRDDSIASLDASLDYFTHTKMAWRIVQRVVKEGREVTVRNLDTRTVVEGDDLSGLAQEYVTGYLTEATFQHFVSLFEDFVGDFLRLWLNHFPMSLSSNEVMFKTVLECKDKAEIIGAVVESKLHSLQYQRVADWFEYIEKLAKLDCPTPDQIKQLAEIKATRDILVHNKGIANAIYVDKSMGRARFAVGDQVDVPEHYHRESWQILKQVVMDVANAGVAKLQP